MIKYLEGDYSFGDAPLYMHQMGLDQGYGAKLTSRRVVILPDGRKRRVYITCYSNAGSAWITLKGERLYLRD